MSGHDVLIEIVILLAVAVVFVPLFEKLGFGSVLGYLLAGLLVGPAGVGLIQDTSRVAHVSEMGVVFLLFIIGLELEPKRLWQWKTPIFGMGSAQMLVVGALVAGASLLFGSGWREAIVYGLACAMSSTAIVSQLLRERNLFRTPSGSSAFSILLFQDIAVIPILALLPMLAGREGGSGGASGWQILLAMAAVVLGGRFLLRPVLRLVAGARLREVFTALSLLLVIGLAVLMREVGLSMALGAFMGGVLLATSEYRHAIETDIEPFKGLLLGLFFMSLGMSVNLTAITQNPLQVAGLVAGIVIVKMASHAALAKLFGMTRKEIPLFSILIAQVGEFAFVVLTAAAALGLVATEEMGLMAAAVALSMALTPLLMAGYDRVIAPRLSRRRDPVDEVVHDDHPEVLIAGFGRVGQIVGRLLYANRIRATVLDHDPDQIELLRRFGFKVYYGDATRLDLLRTAGAKDARVIVVAVDDVDDNLRIVDLAREHFPHLRIVARARNLGHVYELIDRNVDFWERETFDSSLRIGTEVLESLGWEPYSAVRAANRFRDHNVEMIRGLYRVRQDEARLVSAAKQAREDLEKMFNGERTHLKRNQEAWDIHPLGRE